MSLLPRLRGGVRPYRTVQECVCHPVCSELVRTLALVGVIRMLAPTLTDKVETSPVGYSNTSHTSSAEGGGKPSDSEGLGK